MSTEHTNTPRADSPQSAAEAVRGARQHAGTEAGIGRDGKDDRRRRGQGGQRRRQGNIADGAQVLA